MLPGGRKLAHEKFDNGPLKNQISLTRHFQTEGPLPSCSPISEKPQQTP